MGRVTLRTIALKYQRGEPIAMLTAYTCPEARLISQAGADIVLVGDSLAQGVLGLEGTEPVTMAQMIHHGQAARRGTTGPLFVVDLPFLSYQVSPAQAVRNAGRLVKQCGAEAVKLEGASPPALAAAAAIVQAGIPVMGHLGLTPQSANLLGGFRVQGRTAAAARALVAAARALEGTGAFAVVLECLPAETAAAVSRAIGIPTIGIGAGPACAGQVLVTGDLLGLDEGKPKRFVRRYADLAQAARRALAAFLADVRAGRFPGPAESFTRAEFRDENEGPAAGRRRRGRK